MANNFASWNNLAKKGHIDLFDSRIWNLRVGLSKKIKRVHKKASLHLDLLNSLQVSYKSVWI